MNARKLKTVDPVSPGELIRRQEAELARAEAEIEKAKEQLALARQAERDGDSGAEAALSKARLALARARSEAEEIRLDIEGIRARCKAQLEVEMQTETASRWERSRQIAASRLELVKNIEAKLNEAIESCRQLFPLGKELHRVLPVLPTDESFKDSQLDPKRIESAILTKFKLDLMALDPGNPKPSIKTPNLSRDIEESNEWALLAMPTSEEKEEDIYS